MIKIHINQFPPSKKNSKRILRNRKTGKPFIAQSSNAKSFEKEWVFRLKNKYPKQEKAILVCELSAPRRSKYDLSNKFETIADVLVKANILEDDNNSILPVSMAVDIGKDPKKKGFCNVYLMNLEEFKNYVASFTSW